jgi:hypothetical protein
MSMRRKSSTKAVRAREEGWDSRFCATSEALPEYNALYDANMRHYFESPTIQRHLLQTGQV